MDCTRELLLVTWEQFPGYPAREAFREAKPEGTLIETLASVTEATGNKFIVIIDEWDALFREAPNKLEQFCVAFPKGDAAIAEELLSAYLWNSISVCDTAVRKEKRKTSTCRACLRYIMVCSLGCYSMRKTGKLSQMQKPVTDT